MTTEGPLSEISGPYFSLAPAAKDIGHVEFLGRMKARLADLADAVLAGSPADFRNLIADETEKWGKVVKFSGPDGGHPLPASPPRR